MMDATDRLKSHDLRVTKIRLAILDSLSQGPRAKPYAELLEALSDFDRTTLYRTLLALMDKGLIHKALEENGESYYALCGGCTTQAHAHDHIHFKCKECGTVECIQLPTDLNISLPNISVDEINITAKGTCKLCQVS